MSNVIITGATGFVGSNLKPYLIEKDYSLIEVSRIANNDNNIISYETCDLAVFDRINTIIHLAGKAHDLKKVSSDNEYFEVNTELTIKLYKTFLNSKCKTFIFISSVKAAVDNLEEILTEDYKPNPVTAYGRSKLEAEQFILDNLNEDKNVYILRPSMIHGPNNKGNLNLLFNLIKKGIPYPLGNYQNKRSFLSVGNLCFIIEQLIKKKPKSGIYNVADDKPISTNDLVRIIAKTLNKKSNILNIPKPIVNTMAKIGGLFKLPFNTERLEKLTESFIVSNTKIKSELNIEFPISSEEGLKNTIQSLKK